MKRLDNFFHIQYGDKTYTDKSVLDAGTTMLIASQGVENGAYGFFDIPIKYKFPLITVPRTGSIGHSFVQLTPCTITDDCMVLKPKKELSTDYLFYVSALIRFSKWRYNYGRKITPQRLASLEVQPPEDFHTETSYNDLYNKLYPKKAGGRNADEIKTGRTKQYQITTIFDLVRGDFHAIDRLEEGIYPTISRVSEENGLVGFYKKPPNAKIFQRGIITVSTVTGDAFLQLNQFIATDNVVMCIPKKALAISTLFYIQVLLNQVKWRYSYGRQCYKGSLQKTVITLPITKTGDVDEAYIGSIVTKQPYWNNFVNELYA